jgi:neuropeptide F receptor
MADGSISSDDELRYFRLLNLSSNSNYSDLLDGIYRLLNKSGEILDEDILAKYETNRSVDSTLTYYALIAAYTLLIVLGSCGNGLVVVAVVRKPAMRTARNMFIVNLAVSDLVLCLVTMPLTLMEVLTTYWPLGTHDLPCKMLGALQATSIFVSTISITAIALDR